MTAPDMLLVRGDLIERTLATLIAQDTESRRPRFCAWVKAAVVAAKLYEQTQQSAFFGMTYAGAVGRQRDAWGKLLGIYRGGLDETTYRLYQELRIYVATVDATVPRCIALLELALPGRTVTAGQNLPNGAGFLIRGGSFVTDQVRAQLAGLLRVYQPVTHHWYVGEVPDNAIEFENTFDANEANVWPELIFGGR